MPERDANQAGFKKGDKLPTGETFIGYTADGTPMWADPVPERDANQLAPSGRLVLEIEVPDFNVEGAQAAADEFCDGDLRFIVVEEWMREDVGLTFVTLPGEKSMNSDFEVHTRVGRIVGARIEGATDA